MRLIPKRGAWNADQRLIVIGVAAVMIPGTAVTTVGTLEHGVSEHASNWGYWIYPSLLLLSLVGWMCAIVCNARVRLLYVGGVPLLAATVFRAVDYIWNGGHNIVQTGLWLLAGGVLVASSLLFEYLVETWGWRRE